MRKLQENQKQMIAKIIDQLRKHPKGVDRDTISKRIKEPRSTVFWNIQKLIKIQVVGYYDVPSRRGYPKRIYVLLRHDYEVPL